MGLKYQAESIDPSHKSQNASVPYPTMHICEHFCYKMVHCGIWHWCILGFVRWVYCTIKRLLVQYMGRSNFCLPAYNMSTTISKIVSVYSLWVDVISWASYDSRMFFIFLLKPIEAKHGFSYMKLVTKLDNEWCEYGSTVWTRVGFRIRTAQYDTILHIGLQWPNHNTDHVLSSHASYSLSRYGYFLDNRPCYNRS